MRKPSRALSLFDASCIIVGTIIGAGIYETTPTVAACMGGWVGVLAVWLVGGALALCGALCYAELATTYPYHGGDYIYLGRAYGRWAGFMFGWSQMAVIRPGDIALMAFIFARYAATLYAPFVGMEIVYAGMAVLVLTVINILGVRESKWVQDFLTVVKMAGLLLIVILGLCAPGVPVATDSQSFSYDGLKLALILVLFTYGGWSEVAYVAAEIKNPRRNIVRALAMGTLAVAALYLLINIAFLHALGYSGMAASGAVAVDAVATVQPGIAARLIAVIVCISTLGAINGLIFTGARISYALGAGHRLFRWMGKWHSGFGTPMAALALQGSISMAIILIAGSFIDTILYSAPAVWLFFLASGVALFRLRKRDAERERPVKAAGYPLVPAMFCATCVFMLYCSFSYACSKKPVGLLVLAFMMGFGMLLYRRRE